MSEESSSYIAPELAGQAGIACTACYLDHEDLPVAAPPGYTLCDRLGGWMRLNAREPWVHGRVGLVFRSDEDPSTYLIAFRGTSMFIDAMSDFDWSLRPFPAAPASGQAARVAAGFLDIYTYGEPGRPSLREQLLAFLRAGRVNILTVTGHGLGGAICSLFTYDIAMMHAGSSSHEAPSVQAVTFGSPRVGDAVWKRAYDSLRRGSPTTPVTIRVHNTEDYVTYAPAVIGGAPANNGGAPAINGGEPAVDGEYHHIGAGLAVDFYASSFSLFDPVVRHSLLNYRYVVGLAAANSPQVWQGVFKDQSGSGGSITSIVPTVQAGDEFMGNLRRAKELVSMRALGPLVPREGSKPPVQIEATGTMCRD